MLAPATALAVVAVVAKVANGTSLTFAPLILVNPPPSPINVPVPPDIVMLPAFVIRSLLVFKFPLNINPVNVPTDEILGWSTVVRLPPTIPADIAPTTSIEPGTFKLPVVLLYVNPVLPAYVLPPSLNMTCVFAPCAGTNVAVSHDKTPAPSVAKNAPAEPPVMVTLLSGPKLAVLLKSTLVSNPPDTDIEPVIVTAVPVFLTDSMFAVPADDTLIGPLASTCTLLVPFSMYAPAPTEIFVKFAPSPDTYVKTPPVPDMLPVVALPDTTNDVRVPVLVMFG